MKIREYDKMGHVSLVLVLLSIVKLIYKLVTRTCIHFIQNWLRYKNGKRNDVHSASSKQNEGNRVVSQNCYHYIWVGKSYGNIEHLYYLQCSSRQQEIYQEGNDIPLFPLLRLDRFVLTLDLSDWQMSKRLVIDNRRNKTGK